MMKRTLTAGMLAAALIGGCFATPMFAQDQSGQTMQTENKMGDPMMKTSDKMMKDHKKSKRAKKRKTHDKSMKNGDKMKTGSDHSM